MSTVKVRRQRTSAADRRALVDLIQDMVAADAVLARTAPSVGAILRSAIAADAVTAAFADAREDLDDAQTPDEVLRIARVRGQAEAAILTEPMLDAAAAARVMGSRSTNAREYARQLRGRPGVIALPVGHRFVFPAFQFHAARREIWPIAREISGLLGSSEDPWGVASFWLNVDPVLGARPADLVAVPERAADLREAAARELAPVG